MRKIVMKTDNWLLVEEQNVADHAPVVIKTSGYTSDEKAINEPWILTQMRTLWRNNRQHLPDPVIAPQRGEALRPYEWKNVYTFYFTPECKGIKKAEEEFSDYLNSEMADKTLAIVGHSKGGLLAANLNLKKRINMVLIAPTFGTIMGDEGAVKRALDFYKRGSKNILTHMEVNLYKWMVHRIDSRRPVDYDMALDAKYVQKTDFSKLSQHRVLLIGAVCPQKPFCDMTDAFFRHTGKFLHLNKEGDGMVSLANQLLPKDYVTQTVILEATHPTILNKSNYLIKRWLKEEA